MFSPTASTVAVCSWTFLTDAVDGFTAAARSIEWRAPGGKVETVKSGKVVDARLRQRRRLAGHECAFLKSHCAGPFKITLPTPAQFMFASYQKGVTDQFYPRRTDLTADLVAILQDESQGAYQRRRTLHPDGRAELH